MACLLIPLPGQQASAQEAAPVEAPAPEAPPAADAPPPGFWERDTLTGDWGGLRSDLSDQGLSFSALYIGETLANVSGGVAQGGIIEGRLQLGLDIDLEKLAGWTGGTLRVNAFQTAGHGLAAHNLSPSLLGPSNIEATPAFRLFDLSFEQKLMGDLVAVRIGQFAADEEFIVSDTAGNLINSTFGWPGIMAADLPSGGPAFPLTTPGLRLRVSPADDLSFSATLFSGDPAGHPGSADPQRVNASGTSFSFANGPFAIAEAVYKPQDAELPGTYKIGLWYHAGSLTDPNTAPDPATLAALQAQGLVRERSKAYGGYGVVDQLLWHDEAGPETISGFVRLGGAPADRRPVSLYADAGLSWKAPLPERDNDSLTFGISLIQTSGAAQAADRAIQKLTGRNSPVRDAEAAIELTYQYQIAPWWLVQPDLQYDFNPGAGVADPNDPAGLRPVGDAAVIGLRTTISF